MIRETTREESVVQTVVADRTIICNGCGSEIHTVVNGEERFDEQSLFHEIELLGGWADDVIGDMNRVVIHLCLPCVEKLLDSMTVSPMVECSAHQWIWEDWQANGRSWIKEGSR